MTKTCLGILFVGILAAGCFKSSYQPDSRDPFVLDHEIKRALQEKYGFDDRFGRVRVECEFGNVTLSGEVASEDIRQEVLRIAGGVKGIKSTLDQLEVREK